MRNKNETAKTPDEERENLRLREILQKAVNKENAPENLRARIAEMIRRK